MGNPYSGHSQAHSYIYYHIGNITDNVMFAHWLYVKISSQCSQFLNLDDYQGA